MHILIVDDHAFQRRALSSIIAQLDTGQITQAADGHEAMRQISISKPDIIICDLIMPNMDGFALLRYLSEQHFSGSIILSSASDTSLLRAAANLVNSFELNLLGVMPKPSSQQQLSYFFRQHQKRYIRVKAKAPLNVDTSKAALQDALSNGQFINVFQPQIDFKTGKCIGLEVLTRWQHPTFGLLLPSFFVDEIEQHGLMVPMSLALIENSVQVLKKLPPELAKVGLSINLTPTCLTHDTINAILDNQPLMALAHQQRITFELTEQTQILSDDLSLELLSRLRINGFNLSIDDFGTGYSSLQQLNQYPFNEIKIDRSFVVDALTDIQSAAIAEMAIHLAKKLRMDVVVEGVETYEQWVYMKRLGADICQGFFSAKPMKYDQLADWLTQWQAHYRKITPQKKRATHV